MAAIDEVWQAPALQIGGDVAVGINGAVSRPRSGPVAGAGNDLTDGRARLRVGIPHGRLDDVIIAVVGDLLKEEGHIVSSRLAHTFAGHFRIVRDRLTA